MQHQKDTSIRELGRTRLTLRSDLQFTPRSFGGEDCYTIEDPVNSKFYRIGYREYCFVSQLDGHTTISQALATTARTLADAALTEAEAAVICKWLIEASLAFTPESSQPGRLASAAEKASRARSLQRWNPAMIRLPLCHPDRFFEALAPWCSWLFSPVAFAFWLALVAVGAYCVVADWDRFITTSQAIFAPANWLWLVLCWIGLKFLHELSHGLVCKRYRGGVHEAGLMMILLAPLAYVDVTSSWRFRSRWQRIHTAAAGMYCELLIAAAAAIIWSRTTAGSLNMIAFNTVVMASFSTLMFNANPLMKFDGYYILSDLLEIPNLYSSGQNYVQYWVKRYILGLSVALPQPPSRFRSDAIRVYGVSSLIWRIFFSASILLVASTFWRGAGLVLSIVAGLFWLGKPIAQFVHYFAKGREIGRSNRIRFCCITGTAFALTAWLVLGVPWPGAVRAPAIIEYAPLTIVRNASVGFVREILVRPGELVEAGQLLVVLESPELAIELADISLAMQQSQLKLRALEKKRQLAAHQAEQEHYKALETKRREKEIEVDQLSIRSPCRGTVLGRNLSSWLGRYVQAGTEIVTIGDEAKLELQISISQDDLDSFTARLDQLVRVRIPGCAPFSAVLTRVNPRATLELPHPAFAALHGGPVPVRSKEAKGRDAASATIDSMELLAPRFTGTVTPSAAQSEQLRAGQMGIVVLRPFDESIGERLYRLITGWTRQKLQA